MKINKLNLLGKNIKQLHEFYTHILELPCSSLTENSFTLLVGQSELTFEEWNGLKDPFYHLAFNIPTNKIDEAIDCLKLRGVNLLELNQEVIIHFEDWNADSAYFYDPAGNIIEIIARHNLANQTEELFTSKDLLCISEIGIPVKDVTSTNNYFKELGLQEYGQGSGSFQAIGTEEGLIIIVRDGRKWYMTAKDAEIFQLSIETDADNFSVDEQGRIISFEKSDN